MGNPTEEQASTAGEEKAVASRPDVVRTDEGFEITHRGVKLHIPKDALDDFEMLRDLGKLQDPAVAENLKLPLIPAIFTRFFGDVQAGQVLDGIRDPESRRVKIADASTFLFEVFGAINPES